MTEETYVYLVGALFALIFLNIGVWLYVAFAKLTKIESHLANCKIVESNRHIWGGGPLGRMYRLMQISGMLLFPKPIIKNGEADLKEIENLPIPLRYCVKIPFITGSFLFAALIFLWGYGEYAGWLE